MIIDPNGRLVWFDQLPAPAVATNFRPQTFDGKTVLTWWQGEVDDRGLRPWRGNDLRHLLPPDQGRPGRERLLRRPARVRADPVRRRLDHDPVADHDAPSRHGAGTLSPFLDSVVQEVDVHTGLVMWEWHALGHIAVADSYATAANSPYFDAYHINSIQQLRGGRVLISARDTSALYEIDQATGHVAWTLGGKASSFRMERGTRFYFQHDARLLAGNRVSLFDDEGGPPFEARSSRGLILRLDFAPHTATLVHQYRRPGDDTLADSEGSMETVPGGDKLVGSVPTVLLGLLAEWSIDLRRELAQRRRELPRVRLFMDGEANHPSGGRRNRISPTRVSVHASWNGATDVARWQVLVARPGAALRPVASVPIERFETEIAVTGRATTFEVRALGSGGRILAKSNPVSAS